MKNWYRKLSLDGKQIFWLAIFAALGLIITAPICFLNIDRSYSYFFGWLLGSAAEIIGFCTILFMGTSFEEASKGGNAKGGAVAALFGIVRFFLYAVVLVVSAICTFRSQWFGGFDAFNFWTCFGGLVPMPFVLGFFHLFHKEKKGDKNPAPFIDEKTDSEGEK